MTMVIFDDHRFCAGRLLDVALMPEAHSHSQIEINFVLTGSMTYLFGGALATLAAGELGLFWGTVPHRVVEKAERTQFVCLYIPLAVFLGAPLEERLRTAVLHGSFPKASRCFPADEELFRRWREELLSGDAALESIVRDELSARIRRIGLDGWRDLRAADGAPAVSAEPPVDGRRRDQIERMTRFIDERVSEPLSIAAIAAAAGFHPNYAGTVFHRALGVTIVQYVTRQRLNLAQAKLLCGDDPVAQVAFESGFGSLSRFYEAFGRTFGVSPKAYRQKHRRPTRAWSADQSFLS